MGQLFPETIGLEPLDDSGKSLGTFGMMRSGIVLKEGWMIVEGGGQIDGLRFLGKRLPRSHYEIRHVEPCRQTAGG